MGTVSFPDPLVENKIIEYHVPENLKPNFEYLGERVIKENDDRVYVVVGQEGSGKTTWVCQQAKFIDHHFGIDRICFTPEQFLEQITNVPKGGVVVFDEAFRGFSSKASQSKVNKMLVQAMMEVRRRNLIIFIIIPSFILLEHYIAVHRSNALFVIWKKKDKNGKKTWHWKAYNRSKTAEVYDKAKKKYGRIPNVFTSKHGRFWARNFKVKGEKRHLPYETFDEEAYDHKKGVAFGDKKSKDALDESKIEIRRLKWLISQINPKKDGWRTKKDVAEHFKVQPRTVREWGVAVDEEKEAWEWGYK